MTDYSLGTQSQQGLRLGPLVVSLRGAICLTLVDLVAYTDLPDVILVHTGHTSCLDLG